MLRFKGKKAGIPAINEIVLTFLHSAPKPVLIFIFILLGSVLASVILPTLLNMFGYECVKDATGTLQLYQVPIANIGTSANIVVTNLKIWLRDLAGLKDYQLPPDPFPAGDTRYLRIGSECMKTVTINNTEVTGYSALCVNCTTNANWFQALGGFREDYICLSDGYWVPNTWQTPFSTQQFCSQCAPPHPYYFNYSNCPNSGCYFTIENVSDAPNIITTDYGANYYYQQIVKLGGVKRTQSTTDFVSMQCESAGTPQLYFFNIKVFNPTLWIYLYGAYWLVILAGWWYRMLNIY